MTKKILFGSIAILFAAAAVFNINLLQNKNAGDISLDAIAIMAEAHSELLETSYGYQEQNHSYNAQITGLYHSTKTITVTYESSDSYSDIYNGGMWNVNGSINPHISIGLSSTKFGGKNSIGGSYSGPTSSSTNASGNMTRATASQTFSCCSPIGAGNADCEGTPCDQITAGSVTI